MKDEDSGDEGREVEELWRFEIRGGLDRSWTGAGRVLDGCWMGDGLCWTGAGQMMDG